MHERAVLGGSTKRRSTMPVRRIRAEALRGATTLEQQTLPMLILGSFAALALIQVILTW